jgi:hypothetical protein
MIGISEHALALLDKTAEVLVHGEMGPYSVVSYEGRNGYVLSESLTGLASAAEPAAQSGSGDSTVQSLPHRSRRFVLTLVGGMTASAWLAAGAALALI